ncbi:MAG: 7-carboxy-7-deazaguanine synthase QueE [Chitinophagales bacterium]|nr:7-carboxy-7-deazaguanine synthase QueE [Chitinophagales bacterium]
MTSVLNALPLMEHFYTIQGEGYYQGKAAYFIRLAGCDVGCVWCDVKESWDASGYPVVTVEQMALWVAESHAPMVVVTGGEPLMYQLDGLTGALKAKGLQTNIETSGAWPLSGQWDWICLSPKKFKKPLPEICQHANELKIIVYNKSDFEWGEQYAQQVGPNCKLYLQPEWSVEKKILPMIIEYVKQHPQWEVSLQIHKYMDIP